MKRTLVSILFLIYFTVSSGFVVNLHYCMGDLMGVEFGSDTSDECGRCGMPTKEKEGCCQDDVKLVKLDEDQAAATFAIFALGVQQAPPVYFSFLLAPAQTADLLHAQPIHGPPLISEQDTYLLNCVFRI